MVVAQIPLWITHGTTSSGVENLMDHGRKKTPAGSTPATGEGAGGPQGVQNRDQLMLEERSKNQFNMWNNTGSTNGQSKAQDNDDPLFKKSTPSERRSAIYCCDISSQGGGGEGGDGRIATGGGDGKIRIWNLTSLFQTTKVDPTKNDVNGHDEEDGEMQLSSNKKRTMGMFRNGGGYDSSDSSECNNSITSGASLNDINSRNNINGTNTHVSSVHQNESNNHRMQSSSLEQCNDVSSLVKRKNSNIDTNSNPNNDQGGSGNNLQMSAVTDEVIDAKTGKKRKRAQLIQVRPPPQASSSTTATQNNTHFATNQQPKSNFTQKQRLLCTIASHSGSVLTLRFSSSGSYLASAGDDAHVLLYTRTNTPSILTTGNLLSSNSNNNGDGKSENLEHWERIRILRGHNLDVVGLAWAPDDSHLVSCSLDSDAPICVWRLNLDNGGVDHGAAAGQRHPNYVGGGSNSSTLHPYKVLGRNDHTSTVKGVAFDPAGKYFASSGDDPAICIWRAFDDWGLEAKVDSSSGVFRSKKKEHGEVEEDIQALANLSLFRRISFAPDGTHVCGTNATLRGKNIAAMISRNGWGVSVPKKGQPSTSGNTAGAANLVGHKQPVVSSRHCPYFFEVERKKGNRDGNEDTNADDVEPKYSTLLALGDKKGFVSIWSTKKSRPIFKLQCSESRCTVTDIAWGLSSSANHQSIVMLVSLLDGFMVALKFDLPNELGNMLPEEDRHKIFRLKYGIDLGSGRSGKRLVDDQSAPKLIENILQFSMEDDENEDADNESSNSDLSEMKDDGTDLEPSAAEMNTSKQIESRSQSGKKRIQPVLLNQSSQQLSAKYSATDTNGKKSKIGKNTSKSQTKEKDSSVSAVLNLAEKAASAAEGLSKKTAKYDATGNHDSHRLSQNIETVSAPNPHKLSTNLSQGLAFHSRQTVVPPKMNQTAYSIELQKMNTPKTVLNVDHSDNLTSTRVSVVASCHNSTHSPPGLEKGLPCTTLTVTRCGDKTWRDHILGTHCTSMAACSSLLAVGTFDGTVYLYGTSPTSGWDSGIGFRSHSPFVMNSSVVHLFLREKKSEQVDALPNIEMLVLTSDGSFGVYSVVPVLKLLYKGNILAPMNQMCLSASYQENQHGCDVSLPELARIFITESEHLLLVLCHPKSNRVHVGGTMQGFIYNREMEIWTRISDERFLYSNYYTTVPNSRLSRGLLSIMDEVVKGGNSKSQPQRRGMVNTSAAAMFYFNDDDGNSLQSYMTRAHCEDRLACAVALQSSGDFKHWLFLYIRQLCVEADSNQLRFLIDMLLNDKQSSGSQEADSDGNLSCWWLLPASNLLGLNRRQIVQEIIIPEMSKNRSLQRLLNELSVELSSTLVS